MLARGTPQKRPSYWKEMLGGLEEHLASWTKGLGGKHPSYRTNILGGNDGVLTGQRMKMTMYGWFERRVAQVSAEA